MSSISCAKCKNVGKFQSPLNQHLMYCGKHKKHMIRDTKLVELSKMADHENHQLCGDERCSTYEVVPKNTKYCAICLNRRSRKNKKNSMSVKDTIDGLVARFKDKIETGYQVCRAKNCIRRKALIRDGKEEECFWSIVEEFTTESGKVVTKCKECLAKQRATEAKRPSRAGRDYATYDARPERKAAKKAYQTIPENKERALEASRKCRAKQRDENLDEYLRKNTATHRAWIEANPEKVVAYNQKKNEIYQSPEVKFRYCLKKIEKEKCEMKLSLEEFTKLCWQDCYYCGEKVALNDRGKMITNGVDKKDFDGDYVVDNCVSCCKMCNFMKGCMNMFVFIMKATYISSQHNLIDTIIPCDYSNLFIGTKKKASYHAYKNRAENKSLAFDLSVQQFHDLCTKSRCYICHKSAKSINLGIDRVDNSMGYTIDNVEPCCSDCNYLKRDNAYDEFMNKLRDISKLHLSTSVLKDKRVSDFNINDKKNIVKHNSI